YDREDYLRVRAKIGRPDASLAGRLSSRQAVGARRCWQVRTDEDKVHCGFVMTASTGGPSARVESLTTERGLGRCRSSGGKYLRASSGTVERSLFSLLVTLPSP